MFTDDVQTYKSRQKYLNEEKNGHQVEINFHLTATLELYSKKL